MLKSRFHDPCNIVSKEMKKKKNRFDLNNNLYDEDKKKQQFEKKNSLCSLNIFGFVLLTHIVDSIKISFDNII